jgi:DNA polymerase III delta prime subunit
MSTSKGSPTASSARTKGRNSAEASGSGLLTRVLPLPETLLSHHRSQFLPLIRQWKNQDRVPPVLLISGPAGIGKREMAYWLAQVFLCEKSGFNGGVEQEESDATLNFGFGFEPAPLPSPTPSATLEASELPCGQCAPCQKALSGNWIDFSEISPEGDSDQAGSLKIDQFRKLKATQGFSAYEGGYRITLIRDADRLTPQAANSLLKLLEEPPPGWIFLLTASDPSLLLPTLVSRCQKLRLAPLSLPVLTQLLHESKAPADRLAVCASLSQGSLRKALQLAENDTWEKRALIFRFLDDPAAELSTLTDWAAAEDRNFKILMDQFEQVLLDLATLDSEPTQFEWKNLDGKRTLTRHAQNLIQQAGSLDIARAFWLERSARIFRMRSEMNAPLNRKNLVQDFLAGWVSPPKT